jgi:hypothetical protein
MTPKTKKIIITIVALVLTLIISTLLHIGSTTIVAQLAIQQLEDSNIIQVLMVIVPIIKVAIQILVGYFAGVYVARLWANNKKDNNVQK